jgi:hypothetical protein
MLRGFKGFYFHASDEDLPLGTRLRKKPLEGFASGEIYSGSALERRRADPVLTA